jgi:hypothetical protein
VRMRDNFLAAEFPAIKQTYNQQAGFTGDFSLNKLAGKLEARHRTFYYEQQFDGDADIQQVNNIASNVEIGYKVIEPVSVIVNASVRSALDDKTEIYDTKSAGIGLKMNLPINYLHHLQGSATVQWLDGERYSIHKYLTPDFLWVEEQTAERMIPLNYNLRYVQMVTQQLMGFVSYENRSFYDTSQQEFLFNSQFLRGSLKYTFTYDLSNASFVEIGGKYAPSEDLIYKSSNWMAKTEMKVWDKLYIGGGINSMPERLTRYEGVLRYFLSPWNEVFINYIYTDDPEAKKNFFPSSFTTYTSAGIRVMF